MDRVDLIEEILRLSRTRQEPGHPDADGWRRINLLVDRLFAMLTYTQLRKLRAELQSQSVSTGSS